MKKTLLFLLTIYMCFCLSGCSGIKSIIKKIPLFEEADIDALTDKAELAWNEVGKDALKDAATDAANTIFNQGESISWPQSKAMEGIPIVTSGIISQIKETDTITEISIKEISSFGYEEYISNLNNDLGSPVSSGIYRLENRLLSAIYDETNSTLIITVSVIKQTINVSFDETEEQTSDVYTSES